MPRPLVALVLLVAPAAAQVSFTAQKIPLCKVGTAVEFVAPMPTEEIPVFHTVSPNPESWLVQLELAIDPCPAGTPPEPGIREGTTIPSPGVAAPLPTDVNGDGLIGDPHPSFPELVVTMDDILMFAGFPLPPGTNLASFFELMGSELEHGGDPSTTVSWLVDPQWVIGDINGDLGTNLTAKLRGSVDTVFVRHGFDPVPMGVLSSQNPTITIQTTDWISTVDSDALAETPFTVSVEVRIPCTWDFATVPPTPIPLDPVFGPCWGGAMACTGNFPPLPGPGFHPMFPSLDVRFSDDWFDATTGTLVPGGVITGGQCGVIWGSTGASLAYAFRLASVHAWYGVNGFPDTTPLGGGDDQLVYRFVMNADGMILDTDVLPREMMITAAVESTTNCFSITNVRVKHRPDVMTRNP